MGATSMVRGGVTRYLPATFRRESGYTNGDVELQFLDDIADMSSSASSDDCHPNQTIDFEEEEEDNYDGEDRDSNNGDHAPEGNTNFWDNQHQLLQANLFRTSSLESRIRSAAKEAIQQIKSSEMVCSCSSRQVAAAVTSCRNCFLRELSRRLQNAGFNSAICKTKWRSSLHIPSGEHSFVDVIESTSSKKGEVRVIIEVNLRAEFEMGKASEDYNSLVGRLPEVFVGKVERLSNVIKVLCMAAKRCMKDKKMHMGPWRKHRYMQAKWLAPCHRNTSSTSLVSMGSYSHRMHNPKPKASMLTVDLLDNLPNMHCSAVEVV